MEGGGEQHAMHINKQDVGIYQEIVCGEEAILADGGWRRDEA